jgi:predicted metal-dependent peptidase
MQTATQPVITSEEWYEISNALEPHHAVFYKLWQMGKPIFDERIPTACVQFDKEGQFVVFRFNPKFWQELDLQNRLFVICHEALHIVLNHGVRAIDAKINAQAANVAMDVVVNHTLVEKFGFDRKNIDNQENYCWVDTVFKDREPLPETDEAFEHYYNLFEKTYGDGGMGDGEAGSPQTVDDHSGMGQNGDDWGDVIDKLNEGLSDEEKETLKDTVKKHFQKPSDKSSEDSPAGTDTGGQWVFAGGPKAVKKQKWETIIRNWAAKSMKESDRDVEQWARLNRRLTMLPREMILPSEMEVDDFYDEKNKIDVWFFLDTSGSCWNLKDRFFTAAESLPEKRFNLRLFCFDTTVAETTLASRKIYGGGGTSFWIIEDHIQKVMKNEKAQYPKAVFIITDGHGDNVKPQFAKNWHWFLTQGGSKVYISKESNIYNLGDFE